MKLETLIKIGYFTLGFISSILWQRWSENEILPGVEYHTTNFVPSSYAPHISPDVFRLGEEIIKNFPLESDKNDN